MQLNVTAPDFELADFRGQPVSLRAFRGKQHVLLVLNRGLSWPFCRRHMVQLHRNYPRFLSLNCAVIIISPDHPAAFRALWQAEQFPFPGLPDLQGKVLQLYGQQVNWLKLGRMPAQVLIDHAGVLRFAHYGSSMRDLPDLELLLAQLADLETARLDPAG